MNPETAQMTPAQKVEFEQVQVLSDRMRHPMTAQALTTGKPPWAVTCWADDNAVYIEIPCKDAAPYITRYPLSEAGLAKALWLMRSHYAKNKPATNGFGKSHKLINAKIAQPTHFTQEARDRALAILKEKGLLKS